MSADHNLDRQPGTDRLASDIKDIKRQFMEFRTIQPQGNAALNIAVSPTYTSTSTPLPTGEATVFTFTFTPTAGNAALTTFHFTLYEGSVATGNEINGFTLRSYNYDWRWWRDWGATDNVNVKDYVWVRNNTGSTQMIIMKANWRYVVGGGTVTT